MAGPELTDQEKMALADAKAKAKAVVKGDEEMERLVEGSSTIEALEGVLAPVVGNSAVKVIIDSDYTPDEVAAVVTYTPGGGTAYGGDTETGAGGRVITQEDAAALEAKSEAPSDVRDVVDAIVANTGLTEKDLEEAYRAEDVAHALNEAHAVAGSDIDLNREITEAAPDESRAAREFYLFPSDEASKEQLRAWGYDGDFAGNHEDLINRGLAVKLDADDNIFYVDRGTNEVINADGEYTGLYNAFTGVIDTLDHLPDPRAPIGMEKGTFIAEGADVGVVAGRPTVSLSEWYGMYGDNFVDQVTNEDWADVLESVGATRAYANLTSTSHFAAELEGMTTSVQTELRYQYLAGDNINQFIDMPTEDFGAWQQKYADAGIYEIGKLGSFDPKFAAINETVMNSANHNYEGDPDGMRKAWDDLAANPQLLDNYFNTRTSGGGGSTTSRVWRPPAYLAPDYAELSQAVKLTFEDKLGRTPSDAEIELLSTKMKADHRGEFDAQAQAQQLQFFASGGGSAGTVQDVNYAARFQEDFADKYSAELGTLDKIDMSRNITQSALGSVLAADQAIGY